MATTEENLHEVLAELFSIANAAMTRAERVVRAAPVLTDAGITVATLIEAMRKPDLPWNVERANAVRVNAEAWQQALDTAGIADVKDLGELLDMMHRADAAAEMIHAGYRPERDATGRVNWAR